MIETITQYTLLLPLVVLGYIWMQQVKLEREANERRQLVRVKR